MQLDMGNNSNILIYQTEDEIEYWLEIQLQLFKSKNKSRKRYTFF